MNQIKKQLMKLWKDESGQGATEYILLLVIVVGLAITFKGKIMEIINAKLGDLGGSIGGFNSN